MGYKHKTIVIKNKFFIIFLTLYIIGLIFSVIFANDINGLCDKVKSGMEAFVNGNAIYSAIKLSISFFSVSLMLWSFCILVSVFKVTSGLRILVAVFIGYSAGLSSIVLLKAFLSGAVGYMLLCVIPSAVIRFFLWYIFLCLIKMNNSVSGIKKTDFNAIKFIGMLFAILFSDVLISILSIVFGNIFF